MCTVACWLVGWGAPDWRSDATPGQVLGREEKLLVIYALVLLSGLGGAHHCRFVRGVRRDQGCCCAVSLLCR